MKPSAKILIYSDYPSNALDIHDVINYLDDFGLHAEDRGNIVEYLNLSDEYISIVAQRLAASVVQDTSSELKTLNEAPMDLLNSEVNRIRGKESSRGILYDGHWLQRALYRVMSERIPDELSEGYMHVVFTGRLFGTFEDRRYHARVLLTGTPSLISTSGLVEAPAKPREYYYIKGRLIQSGKDASVLDDMYRGKYVEYDDPKITTSILCSYTLASSFLLFKR